MMMFFFWPFILVGVVLLIVWAVRGSSGAPMPMMGCMMGHDMGHGNQPKTAVDVLKERYARGEIDREEYEQKLRDIG